ncbi:MAG: type III secretion protein T, partial [Verrucomicrobia bacterium]
MDNIVTNLNLEVFITTLAYTQPRILAMFALIPLFNQSILPMTIRVGMASVFGLLLVPALMPHVAANMPGFLDGLGIILKEAFLGFSMGFLIAIPFWMIESVGFFIDNQRGASISATLNPLTGNDSSPLGELFNQAFIVFFFISGGFLLMLTVLYDSFAQWNIFSWKPHLGADAILPWLGQLDRLVRVGLLLGAPVIVAMFLAEVGLALVSRFVPSLQVFFLAMPIKSALAFLVLVMYTQTLFTYATEHVGGIRDTL